MTHQQEARDIHKSDEGNVERVTESDKTSPFTDELMSKHPRKRETSPSPTHTGQPFGAGFYRGTKVSSSEKLKGELHTPRKTGGTGDSPGSGQRTQQWLRPRRLAPHPSTDIQLLSRELKGSSHLRHSPPPLSCSGRPSSKGWSSRVCVVAIGFWLQQPQPCVWGNYFLSLRFPTLKGRLLLPPTMEVVG